MGIEIKDKVELEKIIDSYLLNDVPLSLLTETYDLTYPQIQLLINRTIGFQRQTDHIIGSNPEFYYDDLSEDLLTIPHVVREEYPKTFEEVTELFRRLEEIKMTMPTNDEELYRRLAKEYDELANKVSSYDKISINHIQGFLNEVRDDMDSTQVADTLYRNGIGMRDLKTLNEMYNNYLTDTKRLEELRSKLEVLEKEMTETRNKIKKLEYEYEDIRETLTVCNIKLVNWCIRRFFNNIPLSKEETQLYGLEALAKAINEFDYKLGFHFSTFAVPVIVHHIERHFSELYGMSWRNFTNKESIRYYRHLMRENDPTALHDATPQELADLGLIRLNARQIADYDDMLDSIVPMSSVYPDIEIDLSPTRRNEMPTTFEDYEAIDEHEDNYAVRDEETDAERLALDSHSDDVLADVLATLTPREEQVLRQHFGLDGPAKTLEEVGRDLNVTRERVRQIEAKALRKMRHPVRSSRLRGLYDDSYTQPNYDNARPNPRIAIYEKLITLLKLSKSQESILCFMNLDGLNWDTEKLNKYVTKLATAIKYVYENYKDIRPGDKMSEKCPDNYYLSDLYVPEEVFITIYKKIDELVPSIQTYIEKYGLVTNDKQSPKK